jgi:hypothetical protein
MEYRKVSELHKLPNNPRLIRDAQFKTLCDSIRANRAYFEARPLILSDRTGELIIIAGNQRYEAAKAVGLSEVPTFLIPGLTLEREREIIIRDNVANGEFDWDALANEWSDLPLDEWGVDLPAEWGVGIDGIDAPELRDGDRPSFQQMTFTLHDEQVEEVKAAVDRAKADGGGSSDVNENSNGNALAFIAQRFNRG